MRNALTIDVEEYFQAHAYAKVIERANWERIPGRVVANVGRLLALLAEHGTHATFFVLGWVADRHPELVREIAAAGHEVGSHGYAHQLVDRQGPEEFAADLARSLAAIGRALGQPGALLGYRAPGFSLTAGPSGRSTSCARRASATTRACSRCSRGGGTVRTARAGSRPASTPACGSSR